MRVTKPDFLALHVAAGLAPRVDMFDTHVRHHRISALLGPIADENAGKEHHGHGSKDRPALARVPHHLAEHVGQTGPQREDQQHLEQVG